ncbi:MAG: RluA family pseudouridine synthase [bacterium]
MADVRILETPASARGERLDKFLAQNLAAEGFSRSRLRTLFDTETVRVDGRPRPARYCLRGGERLELDLPQIRVSTLKPANISLDILYEDKDLLVVNKPAGLVTHPGAGHYDDTLANALLRHCGPALKALPGSEQRPGIVHRLDKDTSGCLVAAKSRAAFTGLQAMIAAHEVTRLYLALVWGDLAEDTGTIEAPLGRGADRRRMALRPESGKAAVTHFSVRERFARACELECRLETGRTHQIRVHLRGIKHAVVGDLSYGRVPQDLTVGERKALDQILGRQALHAYRLQFKHPVSGRPVRVRAPEPDDYKAARKLLRGAA